MRPVVQHRRVSCDDYAALLREVLETEGCVRMAAPGSSMWPVLPRAGFITVAKATAAELKLGEVVLYCHGGRLRAHRLIALAPASDGQVWLQLQGDNLARPDPLIPPGAVMGRVSIPLGRHVLDKLNKTRALLKTARLLRQLTRSSSARKEGFRCRRPR